MLCVLSGECHLESLSEAGSTRISNSEEDFKMDGSSEPLNLYHDPRKRWPLAKAKSKHSDVLCSAESPPMWRIQTRGGEE
jgi:hypothetical protein